MDGLPSEIAAAIWNLTVGPSVGCLIVGPDHLTAKCQRCRAEWDLGRPLDVSTVAVQPLWWLCGQGCNIEYWQGDDGTLDSLLPPTLIVPPPPPRGPEYATWWNARLGPAIHVLIHDYDARRLRCTTLGCERWWTPAWKQEGPRVSMAGWWHCPSRCNAAIREHEPSLATHLDAAPPWKVPPELARAAAAAEVTAVPKRPGRPRGARTGLDDEAWLLKAAEIDEQARRGISWEKIADDHEVSVKTAKKWSADYRTGVRRR